jgi:hypothetical protein
MERAMSFTGIPSEEKKKQKRNTFPTQILSEKPGSNSAEFSCWVAAICAL